MDERIRPLPSGTAVSVRAGQVVGSLSRAVEELVYNSVEHGKASTVRITLGRRNYNNNETFVLQVQDDGVGIDSKALQYYIGTENCSSKYLVDLSSNRNKVLKFGERAQTKSNTKTSSSHETSEISEGKGESLKALSSLSIQVQITTKCSPTSSQRQTHIGESLQKKLRSNISSNEKVIVKSEKTIRDGITESFSSILCNVASCSISSLFSFSDGATQDEKSSKNNSQNQVQPFTTGTTIIIYGLFHRHAVRRRHYNLSLNQNPSATEKINFSQVRSCLRVMALAYPHVQFILENGKSGSVITSWPVVSSPNTSNIKLQQEKSPTLASNISALRTRLKQICGEGDVMTKKSCIIPIIYQESPTSNSSLQSQRKNRGAWTAHGVLFFPTHHSAMKRSKQYENIFINKRVPLHSSSFCTIVQETVSSYSSLKSSNSFAYFLIHIETARDEVDSIIDESHSAVVVLERQRMEGFLQKAIQKSLTSNIKMGVRIDHLSKPLDFDDSTRYSSTKSTTSNGSRHKTIKLNIRKSELQSTRIISGERIVSSAKPCSQQLGEDANELTEKPAPCSPFSDAFLNECSMFDTASTLKSSFEDAFITTSSINVHQKPNSTIETDLGNEEHKAWTRQRLQAPNISQLSKLPSHKPMDLKFQKGFCLSKEMISNATVIGQLDKKFIVIKAGKFMCVVDQHAAHERVQLERLEKKILSDIFSPGLKSILDDNIEPIIIDGEKDKHWKPEEFELKTFSLIPVQTIDLSPTDTATIIHMEEILKKWKFSFQFSLNEENKLLLSGVPKVCGKTASLDDFINFVHVLENREADAGLCKPAFISRVLASHACRYGIMFGDVLSLQQCNDLIKAVSRCNLPFVCAHGRPSVVPLFDAEGL